jgi:hypothetical protein
MTLDLFGESSSGVQKVPGPLAGRMRPGSREEFVGQERLLGEEEVLHIAQETEELPSVIPRDPRAPGNRLSCSCWPSGPKRLSPPAERRPSAVSGVQITPQ